MHSETAMTPHVVSFATHRAGSLRTVGLGFMLPSRWRSLEDWGAEEAQAFARMLDPLQDSREAAARGKVFFLADYGNTASPCFGFSGFQTAGRRAEAAFCGNSMAAAAALVADRTQSGNACLDVRTGGAPFRNTVAMDCLDAHARRWRVRQQWRVMLDAAAQPDEFLGHRALHATFLNDYLIVEGAVAGDAVAAARQWAGMRSLRGKVVFVEPGALPRATFVNSNGVHGAAPQTGLATLAVLSACVPWLAPVARARAVMTPAGIEPLPAVSRAGAVDYVVQPAAVDVCLASVVQQQRPTLRVA